MIRTKNFKASVYDEMLTFKREWFNVNQLAFRCLEFMPIELAIRKGLRYENRRHGGLDNHQLALRGVAYAVGRLLSAWEKEGLVVKDRKKHERFYKQTSFAEVLFLPPQRSSKITDVLVLKEILESKESCAAVGKRLGLSPSCVHQARSGQGLKRLRAKLKAEGL